MGPRAVGPFQSPVLKSDNLATVSFAGGIPHTWSPCNGSLLTEPLHPQLRHPTLPFPLHSARQELLMAAACCRCLVLLVLPLLQHAAALCFCCCCCCCFGRRCCCAYLAVHVWCSMKEPLPGNGTAALWDSRPDACAAAHGPTAMLPCALPSMPPLVRHSTAAQVASNSVLPPTTIGGLRRHTYT
jgi:hypothetical protein